MASTSLSYTFTLTANKNLVANFTQNQPIYLVTLTASPANGGTTAGQGNYASGTSVTITAQANPGFTFSNWTENGNVVSTNSSYTFTLTANRNVVANFTEKAFAVFPNPSSGVVNISPAGNFEILVFNTLGQLVLSTKLTATNKQFELKKTGFYMLQFTNTNGQRIIRRLIIQR